MKTEFRVRVRSFSNLMEIENISSGDWLDPLDGTRPYDPPAYAGAPRPAAR